MRSYSNTRECINFRGEQRRSTDRLFEGASEMPTQPIAVAYFNRTPVAIDQYLCRERSVNFFSFAVAVALIAVAILLALD